MVIPSMISGSLPRASPGASARSDDGAAETTFRDAYVRAATIRAAAARDTHVVKPGETLYGIARARLAADGEPATPGASMRYALQLAAMNHIRNPDMILVGQRLQLASAPRPAETVATVATTLTQPEKSAPPATHEIDAMPVLDDRSPTPHAEATASLDEAVDRASATNANLPPVAAPPVSAPAAAATDARAHADSVPSARAALALYAQTASAPSKHREALPDIVYKGVVGKALDMVPLEPATRTGLQQANAVISGSFVGRSLAALTGLGGPVLTIAGLAWGLFSAHKIGAAQPAEPKQLAQNSVTDPVR